MCPGRKNLKLQADETNFENCSAKHYFKIPYRNPFQSSSLLAIRTFFCICFVNEMFLHCFKRLFLYFSEFDGLLPYLNLAKIRDTVPLNSKFIKSNPLAPLLVCLKNSNVFFYRKSPCRKFR